MHQSLSGEAAQQKYNDVAGAATAGILRADTANNGRGTTTKD